MAPKFPDAPDVPDWVHNPDKKIRKVVFGVLISGIGTVIGVLGEFVSIPFTTTQSALDAAWGSIFYAFEKAGDAFLEAAESVYDPLVIAAEGSGLGGPIVQVVVLVAVSGGVFAVLFAMRGLLKVVIPP